MNVERVAAIAAATLDRDELETWVMRISGLTYTEIGEAYTADGRPRSRSRIHRTFHRADAKVRDRLNQETSR